MTIQLLNENSNRIHHPKNISIQLKEHQLTSIYAMYNLEQTGQICRNIKSTIHNLKIYTENDWIPEILKNHKNIDYKIETNFGILADIVGSGKSYIIMGLIVYSMLSPEHERILYSSVYSCLKYKENFQAIKTNLIIVPHNLILQWKTTFSYCNLNVYIVAKRSNIANLEKLNIFNKNESEQYDIIICSATMLDDYLKIFKNIKYNRIIIDEICSIKLSKYLGWYCNFTWFITATPSAIKFLIKPYHVKDIHNFIFDNIIIKNNDDYVCKSMNLPNINQILIKCYTPKQYNLIKEYISEEIMDMLNAGDINGAKMKLNCNIDTNDNILKVLTNKIAKELHNKNAELNYQNTIIPSDKKSHDELIIKIKDHIERLKIKYEVIEKRITEFLQDSCPICLDEYKQITPGICIVPCCNNLICIPCLSLINGKSYNNINDNNEYICSYCRGVYSMNKVNIIINNNIKIKTSNYITKINALIKIIKDKPSGKFLLFSDHDKTFDNLNKILDNENINYAKLMGTCSTINKIIDLFTLGKIKVLMLNASNYGSGLNLHMATDIIIYHELPLEKETQVIGRSQRIGRIDALNVYYLLYEHEKNNVSNPVLSLDLNINDDYDKLNKYLSIN
jgi:hypothetical protein